MNVVGRVLRLEQHLNYLRLRSCVPHPKNDCFDICAFNPMNSLIA